MRAFDAGAALYQRADKHAVHIGRGVLKWSCRTVRYSRRCSHTRRQKKSPRMRAFSLRCLRLELTVPCLVDTSLVVNELITAFVNGHYAVGNVIAVTL